MFICAAALIAATTAVRADWPQFRGPDGMGRSDARDLPLTWSDTTNVRWHTPIRGRGWSSPVVLGNQVWVTTATQDGRELAAVGLDVDTGRVRHDVTVFRIHQPQFKDPFNSYASPTPVIEPGRVYVTYGSHGTAAIDTATGAVLWTRDDLPCNHIRGSGSSPILYEHLLILHFDGGDHQYVVALDKATGKTVWRTNRSIDFRDIGPNGRPEADGDFRKAFATPHIATFGGTTMLISLGSQAAYAYEPLTGRELWRVEERENFSASTRPVIGRGMIFFPSGFAAGQVLAVRPDARGMATNASIVWRLKRSVPQKPSLLLVDDLIFMVNDSGIASLVDADTGQVVWAARLEGQYSASPIWAAGRIYVFNEDGKTTVLKAGRQPEILATNQLGDGFMASPAVHGNALILRSRTHLYRIEAPKSSSVLRMGASGKLF